MAVSINILVDKKLVDCEATYPHLIIIMNTNDYNLIFEPITNEERGNTTINPGGVEIAAKNKRGIVYSKYVAKGQFKFHGIINKQAMIKVINLYYDNEPYKEEALKKYLGK